MDQRLAVDDQGDLVVLTLETLALKHLQPASYLCHNVLRLIVAQIEQLRTLSMKPTRLCNVLRGYLLVPGKHPNVDSRLQQLLDRLGNVLLQLVLDGGGPEQRDVLLDQLGRLVDSLLPVRQRGRRVPPLLRPVVVLLLPDVAHPKTESSKTIASKRVQVLDGFVVVLSLHFSLSHSFKDHIIGALNVELYLSRRSPH